MDSKVENVPEGLCPEELGDKTILLLETGSMAHILSHRVERVFLGKKDGVCLKVMEVTPFEYNTPDKIYQLDNIFLLENLIKMIFFNIRVIPAIKDYQMLVTPIFANNMILGSNEQYYIEMPFGQYYLKEMQESIQSKGFVLEATSRYKENIIKSDLFNDNVDYISDFGKSAPNQVREKYIQLVSRCLSLLEDNNFVEFNKEVIRKINTKNSGHIRERDSIETNPYITFKDIWLDNNS